MEELIFDSKDQDQVNKILVLGNGFDLSLGLATSYESFLTYIVYVNYLFFWKYEFVQQGYLNKFSQDEQEIIKGFKPQFEYENYFDIESKIESCFNQALINEECIPKEELPEWTLYLLSYPIPIVLADNFLKGEFQDVESKVKVLNRSINTGFFKIFVNLIFGKEDSDALFGTFDLEDVNLFETCDSLPNSDTNTNQKNSKSFFAKFIIPYSIDKTSCDSFYCQYLGKKYLKAKEKVKSWLDVETFIRCLVLGENALLKRFFYNDQERNERMESLVKPFKIPLNNNACDVKKFYQGVDEFSKQFNAYLNSMLNCLDNLNEFKFDFKRIFKRNLKYYSNSKFSYNFIYDLVFNPNEIINFNYTDTSLKVFKKDSIHINGSIKNNNVIFGTDLNSNLYIENNEIFRIDKHVQRYEKEIFCFQKIKSILAKKYNLVFFGLSFSLSDSTDIKKLFCNKEFQKAYIFCYSKDEKNRIMYNLINILSHDIFF